MTATVTTACRLCDGKTRNILDLGWSPLANALCDEPTPNVPRYPLALARCDTCGHFQLPVRVDPTELFPATYPYASGASASMRRHLDEVATMVANKVPRNGRVLEIGCNDGYLLGQMSHLGLEVMGVDPAATDYAVQSYAVIREPWGGRSLPVGEFDAIVALNVFAHVADLSRAIEQCAAVLKPDGLLMFEVGYFPAMVEQNVFDTIYHEHIDYHTLGALVPFMRRHGLELWHAERIAIQGGSVRCWCVKTGREETRDLMALLGAEQRLDLERYREVVSQRRNSNRRAAVFGYGCPAKAATLVASESVSVRAYIEDNPLKIGKWAPDGTSPIMANSCELDTWLYAWLRSRDPITVIAFAWNMLDEILPKIRNSPARCLRDARVLVPFPEPHYVE